MIHPFQIVSVNVSEKKGTPKSPVTSIRCLPDFGVKGDAHAGPGKRQVSLLAAEAVDEANTSGAKVVYGDFAENITTRGVVLPALPLGTRLMVGDVVLEITQIGKACHTRCEVGKRVGECIMPRKGVFARVITGGTLEPGALGHYDL